MLATAPPFVASPPSPYTVSVGKATSRPSRSSRAAPAITVSVAGRMIAVVGVLKLLVKISAAQVLAAPIESSSLLNRISSFGEPTLLEDHYTQTPARRNCLS